MLVQDLKWWQKSRSWCLFWRSLQRLREFGWMLKGTFHNQIFQTGGQTGDVDLNIPLMMGDQANATQLEMDAVPQQDGAGTVILTAYVLDALTSGCLVCTSLPALPAFLLIVQKSAKVDAPGLHGCFRQAGAEVISYSTNSSNEIHKTWSTDVSRSLIFGLVLHRTITVPSQISGWTADGQTLDTKSSFCPGSVYILSRVCPMAEKVQGPSSLCVTDVEILSNSMIFGQILDKEIQHLSIECPIAME